MTTAADAPCCDAPLDRMVVRPIGVDHFSSVRHLHATALRSATRDALSDDEVAAFVRLVYSPAYADLLMQEEVHGGWLDGELVGTVSWHPAGNSGSTISLGGIFVRHRRLGIGRRLLAVAEAHARQSGFERLSACTTDNAVPFFLALGYETAARGVRTLAADCKLPVAFMRKPLPPLRPALH